jgi:hypothetical protein
MVMTSKKLKALTKPGYRRIRISYKRGRRKKK